MAFRALPFGAIGLSGHTLNSHCGNYARKQRSSYHGLIVSSAKSWSYSRRTFCSNILIRSGGWFELVDSSRPRKRSHFYSASTLAWEEELNIARIYSDNPGACAYTPLSEQTGTVARAHGEKTVCSYFRVLSVFIAATSSFEPDPHRETDWSACVKGTSRGWTRSRLRT